MKNRRQTSECGRFFFFQISMNLLLLAPIGIVVGIVARRVNAVTYLDVFKARYQSKAIIVLLASLVTIFLLPYMATHPLNPNPGSGDRFTLRVPFEVWDVERDMQIGFLMRDRIQEATDDPFYAFNPLEVNKLTRFVTFNNLPDMATIRIFNLAGHLVKVIEKNDETTFARWDLLNQHWFPIASGMYLAYIEIPDVGTKVLKLAIIQEAEVLDVY